MEPRETALEVIFPGDSVMARRCRAYDWSSTAVGAPQQWSRSLRTSVAIVLTSRHPMFLFWGRDLIQFYNDAYRPSLGQGGRDSNALGAKGKEFWTDIWDVIGPQIDQVMTKGIPTWHEDQYLPIERNGGMDDVWWTYGYSPVLDDDDRINGTMVICQEVTERVKTARQLLESNQAAEVARAEAESANRAKSQFLSTMSHELRTPLNAIGGYVELLELGIRGPVTPEQRTDLLRIKQSQKHLLGLVNEVLDLARVNAGTLDVETRAVRAADTVDAALALVRPQAAAKSLVLEDKCATEANLRYAGDEPRVRQILVNLVGNAIKFTRAGGTVTIGCRSAHPEPGIPMLAEGNFYVAFTVADTGIGIAPSQVSRIFDPFTQADDGSTSYTRAIDGVGLGLAISRRLARLMGGELMVESRLGEGSVFTLWLPDSNDVSAQQMAHIPDTGSYGIIAQKPRSVTNAAEVENTEASVITAISDDILMNVRPIVVAWTKRLRTDLAMPNVAHLGDDELQNHAATYVSDVSLVLRQFARPTSGQDLRDGTAILGVIAERHGAQRARLGWPQEALARETTLLRELIDDVIRAHKAPQFQSAIDRACKVVAQLFEQAERVILGGFRLAVETDSRLQ